MVSVGVVMSVIGDGDVETLGGLYYKRVPLPHIPEYHDLNRDSQLAKPVVEIAGVAPNIISNCPNGYYHIVGCRRTPSTPCVQYHSLYTCLPHTIFRHTFI